MNLQTFGFVSEVNMQVARDINAHAMVFHPPMTSLNNNENEDAPPALPPKTYNKKTQRDSRTAPRRARERPRSDHDVTAFASQEPEVEGRLSVTSDAALEKQLAATMARAREQHMRNINTCLSRVTSAVQPRDVQRSAKRADVNDDASRKESRCVEYALDLPPTVSYDLHTSYQEPANFCAPRNVPMSVSDVLYAGMPGTYYQSTLL